MSKAIVLLSGGLDSVVSLAGLRSRYTNILALTFDYSQKSLAAEIKSSSQIAKFYGINHRIIKLDWLNEISNSALNKDKAIPVLNEKELDNKNITRKSAQTVWIPNRNALFINIAGSFAEGLEYDDIIIGANKEEGATFIDNSKEFINAANNLFKFSVNSKIEIKAPLIDMTKEEIVKKGIALNIPFKFIYSCYNGAEKHCGECESCLRLKRALKNCQKNDIIDCIFG